MLCIISRRRTGNKSCFSNIITHRIRFGSALRKLYHHLLGIPWIAVFFGPPNFNQMRHAFVQWSPSRAHCLDAVRISPSRAPLKQTLPKRTTRVKSFVYNGLRNFPLPRDFFCTVEFVCWGRRVVLEKKLNRFRCRDSGIGFYMPLYRCGLYARCVPNSVIVWTTVSVVNKDLYRPNVSNLCMLLIDI